MQTIMFHHDFYSSEKTWSIWRNIPKGTITSYLPEQLHIHTTQGKKCNSLTGSRWGFPIYSCDLSRLILSSAVVKMLESPLISVIPPRTNGRYSPEQTLLPSHANVSESVYIALKQISLLTRSKKGG